MMKKLINLVINLKDNKITINNKTEKTKICIHTGKTIVKIKRTKVKTSIPENQEIKASHIYIKSIKNKAISNKKSMSYINLNSDSSNSFMIVKTTGLWFARVQEKTYFFIMTIWRKQDSAGICSSLEVTSQTFKPISTESKYIKLSNPTLKILIVNKWRISWTITK